MLIGFEKRLRIPKVGIVNYLQTLILRNPTIRAKLNIPAIVKRQTAEQSKPKSLIQV